ncbi:YqaJ viral recombinase family protein [Alicyclobacillus kakegawensis]|uniref:YqaJ viral recombinase family nuclease n=1 Tax=Alicyclobacillus kakegawensis TaxID=392012 RepID=UPI00082C090D|nr:YqaJ viral recombinase family protein [Alicyclobacillus kakegawensis]
MGRPERTYHVLKYTRAMPRAEWLRWRREGIGGSDAPAILGLSPWRSPLDVYWEKVRPEHAVEVEDSGAEEAERLEWGHRLEDTVAVAFAEKTGLHIRRKNALLRSIEHPYMIGDVDREIRDQAGRKGILEIKTTSAFQEGEWRGDRIPDHYYAQLQHYLALTGYDYGYFAVLIGGQKLVIKPVSRDQTVIQTLVKVERDFWRNHVEQRKPPFIDGGKAAAAILREMFPETVPDRVQLPADADRWVREYEEAEQAMKAAAERKELAANQLKYLLAEHESGVAGGRLVSWKAYESTSLDTAALKREMPDLYQRFARKIQSRRFSIKPIKEELNA